MKVGIVGNVFDDTCYRVRCAIGDAILNVENLPDGLFLAKIFLSHGFADNNRGGVPERSFWISLNKRQLKNIEEVCISSVDPRLIEQLIAIANGQRASKAKARCMKYFGIVVDQGSGQGAWGDRIIRITRESRLVDSNPIDTIGIFMKTVIA